MPELASLDEETRDRIAAFAERLRQSISGWADRFVVLVRQQVPELTVLSDVQIRDNALAFLEDEVFELTSLRVPDDALRRSLAVMATERAALGISPEALTAEYQLGSRELLALTDSIAAEVGLPHELLIAVHDSTWEFANEAAAVFSRVQRELSVERARFDAERRAGFVRAVLLGRLADEQLRREAPLFGFDPRSTYVTLVARPGNAANAEALRRLIAVALKVVPSRLGFADMDTCLGCIAPARPAEVPGHIVAAGPALPLADQGQAFDDAMLALETAEHFGMGGVVGLEELGPKPLVLAAGQVAARLEARHLTALLASGTFGSEMLHTIRILLECNQQVDETARRLTVHPNTVRYREGRFREATGLDLKRTEDLVTTWWLLNRAT